MTGVPGLDQKKRIDWDNAPLGQMSDPQVAKLYRCTVGSVFRARTLRGIPAYPVRWNKGKSIVNEYLDLLGKLPDTDLAETLGVHKSTITKARKKHYIPKYKPVYRDRTKRMSGEKAYIDWDAQPLEEESNDALAEKLGVRASTVYSAKKVRGISGYTKEYIWHWGEKKGQRVKVLRDVDVTTVKVQFEDGSIEEVNKGGLRRIR